METVKKKECGTCKEIEEIALCNKAFTDEKSGLTEVLKSKLVTQMFDSKGKICGAIGYRAREINFCPECGKKIEENRKKWKM